jgi:putative peptidoglycan lipid II flippase
MARGFKISEDNRKIAGSMLLVAGLVGAAKIIGALKEVGLADRYGTSPVLDAYALNFNLLTWPISVYFSAVTAVLVPVLVGLGSAPAEEREEFFRETLGITLVASIAFGAVFAGAIYALLSHGILGANVAVNNISRQMCVPLALIIPLGIIASLLSTRLMSSRNYISTFFEAIPSVALLLAILISSRSHGSGPLIWGTVVGYFAYVGSLLAAQPSPRSDIIPSFSLKSKHWGDVGRSSLLMLAGQIIFTLGGAATDQVLVSHLGPGSNSTLGYAARLLMLINTLGATAVARATLPVLSAARLRAPGDELDLTVRWVSILFWASLVACLVAAVAAPFGITLLFRHGAFTDRDAKAVTDVFRFGLLQIPFYFSGIVIVQLLSSRRKYGLFIIANSISLAVKLAAAPFFLHQYGVKGLFVASAMMQASSTLILFEFLRRERLAGNRPAAAQEAQAPPQPPSLSPPPASNSSEASVS